MDSKWRKQQAKKQRRILAKARAAEQKRIRNEQAKDPSSDRFLRSIEWKTLRYRMLKARGARCECCGATAQDGERIVVDHIKPRRKFPELALEPSNLQVLCSSCNWGKGSWDETDWRIQADAHMQDIIKH